MSVVKETRQIFSVADIKAIRLKCNGKDCKAEVVISPVFPYVDRCPQCGQAWREPRNHQNANDFLLNAIKEIVEQPPELMTIRFEIDGGAQVLLLKTLDNPCLSCIGWAPRDEPLAFRVIPILFLFLTLESTLNRVGAYQGISRIRR